MNNPVDNTQLRLRIATKADAAAMLEIYAPAIIDSPISFEVEVPTLADFEDRIEEINRKYPWLVCEIVGESTAPEIVGYAYASQHRTRSAYAWSVESTVYVKNTHRRQGVGSELYKALFGQLKARGFVNVFAGITLPNAGSVRLHESLGFVHVGTYKDVGFKIGRWWDVGWWQLQLQRPERPANLQPS